MFHIKFTYKILLYTKTIYAKVYMLKYKKKIKMVLNKYVFYSIAK